MKELAKPRVNSFHFFVFGILNSTCTRWECLLWSAVCSHLACLTLQLLVTASEGDWGKLGVLSQVTAVQDCQALPADTASAGSDEEENVLQQKTNIKP